MVGDRNAVFYQSIAANNLYIESRGTSLFSAGWEIKSDSSVAEHCAQHSSLVASCDPGAGSAAGFGKLQLAAEAERNDVLNC